MSEEEKTIQITEEDIQIPVVELLTGRGFITGTSGAGKSNTLGKIAEEILKQNIPLLIIDTHGEHWGLKENYEILHIGAGEKCDMKVGPEHAEKIVDLAIEKNVPIDLDVDAYVNKETEKKLIKNILKHLYEKEKKHRKPFLVVIEEVQEYAPQTGGGEPSDRLHWWIRKIAEGGRKRGLGLCGLAQRPARVDKNYVSEANWRIWHQLTWSTDFDVVRKNVGKKYEEIARDLEVGDAILDLKFKDNVVKEEVSIKQKETVDLGQTPDLEGFEIPTLKSVSQELVDELEEISEQERQKKSKLQELEEEVEKKEDRIEELEEEVEKAQEANELGKKLHDAILNSGSSEEVQEEVQEIKQQKNEEIRQLKKEKEEKTKELKELNTKNNELQKELNELEELKEVKKEIDKFKDRQSEVKEALSIIGEAVNLEVGHPNEKLKNKIQNQKQRIEELESKLRSTNKESIDEEFRKIEDFLKNEAVQEAIQSAINKSDYAEDRFWEVMSVLAKKTKAERSDITKLLDVSKSTVGSVLNKLKEQNVVAKTQDGKKHLYYINTEGLKEVIKQERRKEAVSETKNRLKQKTKKGETKNA